MNTLRWNYSPLKEEVAHCCRAAFSFARRFGQAIAFAFASPDIASNIDCESNRNETT
jgi:hypothetical protein